MTSNQVFSGQVPHLQRFDAPPAGGRRHPALALAIALGILLSLIGAVSHAGAAPGSAGSVATAANRSCDPCPVVTTDDLNLRTGPGTSYKVILVIRAETEVLAYAGVTNGYSKVEYGKATGWAHRDYLRSPDEPRWIGVAATMRRLNFREGPSSGHAVRAVMPANSIVKVTDLVVDGFRYMAYNGTPGWAYDDYLYHGSDAVATRRLAIRAEPRATAKNLGAVPAWETVTAFGDAGNGYVLIMYKGNVGWVQGRYLS